MRERLSAMIPHSPAGRRRMLTAVILTISAFLLLIGAGKRLLDVYDRFQDADYITAVSLVMAGVPKDALPVTLFDIDDRTKAEWQNPPRTPPAAVARLIAEASRLGAAVVVSDVDLSADNPSGPADPVLLAVLANYPEAAPPLLLARRISFTRGEDGEFVAQDTVGTPYDGVVSGKPNIRWITTLNDISGDRQVRRLRLWQTVCRAAGGTAYPSAALVAAGLLFPGDRHAAELDQFLNSRADSDCRKSKAAELSWPTARGHAATLPFVIPERSDSRSLFRISHEGRETVVFRRISAGQIVTMSPGGVELAGELDRDPIAGRAVIIGVTHADSSDFYNTPLGTMPGALILANSIVQAKVITGTLPIRPWFSNLLTLAMFLIFAFIARKLQSAPSVIVIGVVSLAALFIISRIFSFADGVNVLAIAVPGFALFKLVDSVAQIALNVPGLGWRALLKK